MSDTQSSRSPKHRNKIKEVNNGRNRKKNTSRRIVLLVAILVVIFIAFFVEVFGLKTELFGYICAVFFLISQLLKQIVFAREKKRNVEIVEKSIGEDKWTNVIRMVRRFCHTFWRSLFHNSLIFFLLMLEISLVVGTYLGINHIYARSYYAMKLFIDYDKQTTQLEIEEKKQKENIANSVSGEKVLANQDGTTKKLLSDITVSVDELQDVNNLSSADRNELFYLDGDYKISDWENTDEINKRVLQRIRDEIRKGRKNVFDSKEVDGGAPQPVCDRISKLSEKEKTVKTLEEKKSILEERDDIFIIYPKGSLCKLISNDYQDIALIFYFGAGNQDTILYYYGQSIKYRHQIISFKGLGNSGIKNRINELRNSYEDLEIIFANDKEGYYAKKLKEAYQYAANQY